MNDPMTSDQQMPSHEEWLKMLLPVEELRATRPALARIYPAPLPARPPRLDWRSNNGNFVTGVKMQVGPNCGLWAAAALVESKVLIGNQSPGIDLDLSEWIMMLNSCNLPFLIDVGLPPDDFCPSGSATARPGWELATARLADGNEYFLPGKEQIQDTLQKGPVNAFMGVHDDLYGYLGTHVYRHDPNSPIVGAHWLETIGYDDIEGCFIVKNSWGSGWGDAGFGKIAYEEMDETASSFGRHLSVPGDAILPLAKAAGGQGFWKTGGNWLWWAAPLTSRAEAVVASPTNLGPRETSWVQVTRDRGDFLSGVSFSWAASPGTLASGGPDEVRLRIVLDGQVKATHYLRNGSRWHHVRYQWPLFRQAHTVSWIVEQLAPEPVLSATRVWLDAVAFHRLLA